jgi:hypothetical protein
MVGDCVHNARSALDHLVFQLAILNNAPADAASKVSFPVYLTPSEFKNATRTKIAPFINSTSFAEIEKLQPYITGNDGVDDILWVLSQLDIFDKHRLLIVTKTKVRPVAFKITVPSGETFSQELPPRGWKSSEAGTELIRLDLSKAIRQPGKVGVEIATSMTVQIENTGLICDGMEMMLALRDCVQYVANIIGSFGQMFFSE